MMSGPASVPSEPMAETTPSVMLRCAGETARAQAVIVSDVAVHASATPIIAPATIRAPVSFALPKRPSLIVVDTLHRFLLGDENSAQDAKTMLDACGALMAEFNCSVLLVHHTGVSDEAQHRARGSSAWRGALDIEISIVPGKDGGPIQIVQRKSKDAELAEPVWAELTSVTIPGWVDEDGQPVTSAVVSLTEAPAAPKKESRVETLRKQFEAAWWASGAEDRNGMPYLTREAFLRYLTDDLGCSTVTAANKVRPGSINMPIGALLAAEIIARKEEGWIVINELHAQALMTARSTR